jgi:hypothetical protein
MYLRARRYFSGWGINNDAEMNEWEKMLGLWEMQDFVTDASPHGYIEFCVGYWRKAHDVHDWFVRNVQGGVDECKPAPVRREELEELRTECLRQLVDMGDVDEHEDSEAGWRAYQLKSTVAQIDKALILGTDWEFIYQSSW